MNIKNLYLVASMAVAGLAFTACSHSDYIDENAAENNQKALYADNFVKKYGAIDPNQTWDFSSSEIHYALPSSGKAARTRGLDSYSFEDNTTVGEIEVEKDVLEWMYTNMPKGQNNKVKGQSFNMVVPDNPFTIAPIYQGCATYYWQLYMSVEGIGDYLIWEKGQDFYYKETATSTWEKLGVGKEGLAKADNNGQFAFHSVKAPTYTFNNLPKDAKMYFYLKVWKNGSHELGYDAYLNNQDHPNSDKPTTLSSLAENCKMISLTQAQRPEAVENGYDVTIIGCEDGTDDDFEDLVFMVYGKPVPPTERVVEKETYKVKRYFMEDLGATDDFDFNDVVVDVWYDIEKNTKKYDNTTDALLSDVTESQPDRAYVRAAGGILNFTLTIGTTTWTKSDHMTNYEVMWNTGWGGTEINPDDYIDEPFEVEGFIPGDNNISLTVAGRGNNTDIKENVTKIPFPKKGEAPMIIACDPDCWEWMPERVSIPGSWWTE